MENTKKSPYVSVIKMNGVPILPPVITPGLGKQLLNYKLQAIRLEQELEIRRSLKMENLEITVNDIRPLSQPTFDDDRHINVLGISDNTENSTMPKYLHLSKDLIEVSEYNTDGLKIISHPEIAACDNMVSSCDQISFQADCRCSISPRPRLLRSNSYTLETPSPILLAHLKNRPQLIGSSCLSSARNWSSLEDNRLDNTDPVLRPESNELMSIADLPKTAEKPKTSAIEVYQTDFSVQQVTVNATGDSAAEQCREKMQNSFFSKNALQVVEPGSELLTVLDGVPYEYAHQIIDLLRKQQVEQKECLDRHNQLNNVPPKHSSANESVSTKDNGFSTMTPSEGLRRSSTFSMSPSQSLYYSITSDSETQLNTSMSENAFVDMEPLHQTNTYWEVVLKHNNGPGSNCIKQLFPEIDPTALKTLEKERAASVIGSAMRGYLIRRLIRTEKVQSLIATVKDVLTCALELHHSDNIDEKDVELHRRLINQLSAALHSFHDIFFDLSIGEQMEIIRADRQRKLDKLNRPQSSRSSSRHTLISASPSLTKLL